MNLPVFVWFIFAMFFPFLFTAFAISFIAYTVYKSFSCMGVDKLIVNPPTTEVMGFPPLLWVAAF